MARHPMNAMEATRHAHHLWRPQGQGVAVLVNGRYLVGIVKDRWDMHIYGESLMSFEDAFTNALEPA